MGGPSAKVGSSAKLCVLVFKSSLLDYLGVHLTKCVCLPSVVSWHSRHLSCIGRVHLPKKVHLPSTSLASRWGIHQQKKVHLPNRWGVHQQKVCLPGGSIGRRRFICWGVLWQKKVHLPNLSSFQVLLLLHRRSFRITYKRPNKLNIGLSNIIQW